MVPADNQLRVVIVSAEPAFPINSGGRIAVHNMAVGLAALGAEVDVVALTSETQPDADTPYEVHEVALFDGPASAKAASRLRLMALSRFDPHTLWRDPGLRSRYQSTIARLSPDVAVFNHTYFTWDPGFPRVTVAQNVESDRLRRELDGATSLQYLTMLSRERKAVSSGGEYLCFSESDRLSLESLGARGRVGVAPIGVDVGRPPLTTHSKTVRRVLYLGSFDYAPNREAAEVLASQTRQLHRVGVEEVVLAGRRASKWLAHLDAPGLVVRSDVPDAAKAMCDADALVVALLNGGGIRVKILEAFALGVPVVSTPVGCEGIGAVDGIHLRVADPMDLAAGVVALGSPEDRLAQTVAAYELWAQRFTPAAAAEAVLGAAHRAIGVSREN